MPGKPTLRSRAAAAALAALLSCSWAAPAAADVQIEATPLRDVAVPAGFDLQYARYDGGADGTTYIAATVGEPAEASCDVIVMGEAGASLFEYQYDGKPTQCVGLIPHPEGGFFLRGSDPNAEEGEVTGFTALIDAGGNEAWKIPDRQLVDALDPPAGPGGFRGTYHSPLATLAYSVELDKLLAFTASTLQIGLDQKFLSTAHVIDVSSGQLQVSGQEFGQSGVGRVGAAKVLSDGRFIVYFFSAGDQGATFYTYNGRSSIDFYYPRGEEEAWLDRYVVMMAYEQDLLHLLWTPSDGAEVDTRVTVTTDSGAELWSQTWTPEYTFADGEQVSLGRPIGMWVGAEHTLILYVVGQELLARVVDRNGESLGVSRLDVTSDLPLWIVTGAGGALELVALDEANARVRSYALSFTDVADYDPDAGHGDAGYGPDADIEEIVKDRIAEEIGCCATVSGDTDDGPGLGIVAALMGLVGLARLRRRRRG